MRRQQVFPIMIPPQVAHDLGDRQWRKWPMGLQTESQQIGEHLDPSSRIQTMPWSLPRPNLEDRFTDLPATFDEMRLLPNVPDLRPPQHNWTQVHQRITAGGAFRKKEAPNRTKGWTVSLDSTRRHLNPPWGMTPHHVFFPGRGILLFSINRQGGIAFACHDDVGKAS